MSPNTDDRERRLAALEGLRKSLARLRELEARKADLYRELAETLAIRAIFPEAFEDGRSYRNLHVVRQGRNRFRTTAPPQGGRLVLILADGDERSCPFEDLPPELHPVVRRLDPRR